MRRWRPPPAVEHCWPPYQSWSRAIALSLVVWCAQRHPPSRLSTVPCSSGDPFLVGMLKVLLSAVLVPKVGRSSKRFFLSRNERLLLLLRGHLRDSRVSRRSLALSSPSSCSISSKRLLMEVSCGRPSFADSGRQCKVCPPYVILAWAPCKECPPRPSLYW